MRPSDQHPALTALDEIRPLLLRRFAIPLSLRSKICIDDVLQEIARTLLRTSTTVEYPDRDWRNAVYLISMRQLRKQLAIAKADLPHCAEHPEQSVPPSTPIVEILDFSSRCNERQRRILSYRFQGYSFREIGKFEGLEETAIRRQMKGIIEHLESDHA